MSAGRTVGPTPEEAAAVFAALEIDGAAPASSAENARESAWRVAARREAVAPFVRSGSGETR